MSEASTTSAPENTSKVSATETIEVSGGGAPVTFDELEALETRKKRQIHSEAKKEAQKEKLIAKELGKDGKHKESKRQLAGDSDDASAPEESEEVEAKDKKAKPAKDQVAEDNEESEDKVEADAEKKEKKRLLKVKNGDEEVEIDLDLKVPVTIDGSDLDISLDELRNNYSGKVVWDKKFRELNVEKQSFHNQKNKIDKQIGDVFELAKSDPMKAFFTLAEQVGADPVSMQVSFLNNAGEALEEWKNLSDTDKKLFEANLRNQFLTKRHESEKLVRETEKNLYGAQERVNQIQETQKIPPEQFWSTFEELETLQKQGKLNLPEITADIVAKVIVTDRNLKALRTGLQDLALSEERMDVVLREMLSIADSDSSFTPEDLVDIAKEVYGQERAKALTKRVLKSEGMKVPAKDTKPKNPAQEPTFFDDL